MLVPQEYVSLAPHCTLGVGGPARFFVEARSEDAVLEALEWSRERELAFRVLGGGSNVVVGDAGVGGLVVKMGLRGLAVEESAGSVELTAAAGEPWDDMVGLAVERGWAGIECLSGIPGLVGATPIQNVGAYGQEVSETVSGVRALDRQGGQVVELGPEACAFGYRDSAFKTREPERWVILAVRYRLKRGGAPRLRYAELGQHLEARGVRSPSLAQVRQAVLEVRRSKSMVLDPADPNRRSCGSFFLNPLVTGEEAARVEARAGAGASMPRWVERDGRLKLSAAWLIERAGLRRGETDGPVGLSTRHALAIVCHEGARAGQVIAFARRVRDRVEERFGIRLVPEPVFWGIEGFE
jgi:UDP-N-acetylmuramate dehydrogenase